MTENGIYQNKKSDLYKKKTWIRNPAVILHNCSADKNNAKYRIYNISWSCLTQEIVSRNMLINRKNDIATL